MYVFKAVNYSFFQKCIASINFRYETTSQQNLYCHTFRPLCFKQTPCHQNDSPSWSCHIPLFISCYQGPSTHTSSTISLSFKNIHSLVPSPYISHLLYSDTPVMFTSPAPLALNYLKVICSLKWLTFLPFMPRTASQNTCVLPPLTSAPPPNTPYLQSFWHIPSPTETEPKPKNV